MTDEINFADAYRLASLSPTHDEIERRQQAINDLQEVASPARAVHLARLYYGLPPSEATERDWFLEAFRETDASFSLLGNEREAALLAGYILHLWLTCGEPSAGLATLAAESGGNREPIVLASVVNAAKEGLLRLSVESRKQSRIDSSGIRQPAASKTAQQLEKLQEMPTWDALAPILKQILVEARQPAEAVTRQLVTIIPPLVQQLVDAQEELEMLWWFVGGWSRILNKPFSELPLSLAATMAGIDLANLSRTIEGPPAAIAILHRIVVSGRKVKLPNVSVEEVVREFPLETFSELGLSGELAGIADVCPVLGAIQRASDIGDTENWKPGFEKMTGLAPSDMFGPLQLATQVYREALLVAALG